MTLQDMSYAGLKLGEGRIELLVAQHQAKVMVSSEAGLKLQGTLQTASPFRFNAELAVTKMRLDPCFGQQGGDLVLLSGFMRVLSADFLAGCHAPVINQHPALLPDPGRPFDASAASGGDTVTTSAGIGGDPINGSSFVDMLALFEQDPETEVVMMIGEIGGPQEADAALFVKEQMTKPVVGYVAGLTAPKGRRMGHAGAIISAFGDTAAEKAEIMRSAGLVVAPSPAELGATVARALARQPSRPVMVAR